MCFGIPTCLNATHYGFGELEAWVEQIFENTLSKDRLSLIPCQYILRDIDIEDAEKHQELMQKQTAEELDK